MLFFLTVTTVYAQKRVKVTGYVRDADGNPLELVNILVKNTLNGTMTNEKGFYSLNVTPGDSVTFIYSCLGYNKAERIIPSLQAASECKDELYVHQFGRLCRNGYPKTNLHDGNHASR